MVSSVQGVTGTSTAPDQTAGNSWCLEKVDDSSNGDMHSCSLASERNRRSFLPQVVTVELGLQSCHSPSLQREELEAQGSCSTDVKTRGKGQRSCIDIQRSQCEYL